MTYNLRKDISKKINHLPLNYFESRTNGEILSRVTNDIDTLQMSLNQSLTQLITSVTTLIGVFIMMLSINVWMTLAALLILPVSMFIIQMVMKHSQKYFQAQQNYLGAVNGQIEENFGGHDVVRVFNKENDVLDEFEKDNRKLYESAWKSQFFSGMMMPIMQFVVISSHFSSISVTLHSRSSRSRRLQTFCSLLQQLLRESLNSLMRKRKYSSRKIRILLKA